MNETIARLILMEDENIGFYDFARWMKREDPDNYSLESAKESFTMFRGWDGMVLPTHCYRCGKSLTGHPFWCH